MEFREASFVIGQIISHYKILEKLGEGGMGVVYKAHDLSLDRPLALKFLPHYLASDAAEKERFYHEARAASSLSHPNITTIYEISEFDGQLFLAMEYVEGQTLKQVLDLEPLPVKRVLEIAIQACDGLVAAGEKGIVHRDIKSDNMMITPKGQVKIMDFGLAKIKGSAKLTKAGSTLGTAAYMSPEQARGEEVDHRSDIFSFGVVLYELFTGRLPFRGDHHAALVYSLMNEDPLPLARFNDKVTPEMERIVLKALSKDREERYQHVDELLADLRRERKHLEYARSGYVAATTTIPMVAQTQAQPSNQPSKGARRIWTYAILSACFVILALVLVMVNPFNFHITAVNSGAESGKSSLAVMYFESIPDPEDRDHTAEMLTNLLTTSLFQTRDIDVISRERLYDIQKELGQADTKVITPSTATMVAQRAGVSMMLMGSILQKQPSLAITYRLVEVRSGKIMSTQRLSGFAPDRIFSLVDTLALLVKSDLHVGSSAPSVEKSVASVTTTSPEAYRSYLEGVEQDKRFYGSEAKAAFKRAIELDSNFAMAYFRYALVSLGDLTIQEIDGALSKAFSLSGNVTEKERLSIQSAYMSQVEKNIPKAVSLTEELVQKYPHEQGTVLQLGFLYSAIGEFDKAAQTFLRGIGRDSLDKSLWNILAYSFASLGRREEAFHAIGRYVELAPAEPNPYDSRGDIYALFGDYDSAAIWWRKASTFRPDFPSIGKILRLALVRRDDATAEACLSQFAASKHEDEKYYRDLFPIVVFAVHGELTKARSQLLGALSRHRGENHPTWITDDLSLLAMLDYEMRDYSSMVQHSQERSRLTEKDQAASLHSNAVLAVALLKSGNREEALRLSGKTKAGIVREDYSQRATLEYCTALLLFEEGKYEGAREHFDGALRLLFPNRPPFYHAAVCMVKSGHFQEALPELERLTRWIPVDNPGFDLDIFPFAEYATMGIASAKAYYWLGIAQEQLGQRQQAVKSYQKFLEIWRNADFTPPELADARARLAKLQGLSVR